MTQPDVKTVKDERGRIKKGYSLNPKGKPKGTVNKLTMDMKNCIEAAAAHVGEAYTKDPAMRPLVEGLTGTSAYLAVQAIDQPVAFMGLLKGLLPAKLDIDVTVMNRELVTLLSARREQLATMRDITPEEEND